MWRNLHSLLGLASLGLLLILSVSGAILATSPLAEALRPEAQAMAGLSVADVVGHITAANPDFELERIKVRPSSMVEVYGRMGKRSIKALADLQSGNLSQEFKESAFYAWMRDLHRSLFLGFMGRAIAFGTVLVMTLMCLSGLFVLVRRMGGWRQLFAPTRGRWFERLHALAGRFALVPLSVTALSGTYLSSTTMGLLPSGEGTPPAYPESLKELQPVPAQLLHGLQETPMAGVREVSFPIPEDWFDVFTVKTQSGHLFFDQFTGDLLSEQPFSLTQRLFDLFTLLHTAEGAAPWGIVAGVAALSVPLFALTGFIIWLSRMRSGAGRIRHNAAARDAQIVIAVGSENNSTWGFAKALHQALVGQGFKVQTGAMNDLRVTYPAGKHLLVLAATFGDGDAPSSAVKFGKRLAALTPAHLPNFAVLGFGDKAFHNYCQFALETQQALTRSGRQSLLPLSDINRKSAQSFTTWCRELGLLLECDLQVDYTPPRRRTQVLTLVEKQVFGTELQRPTAILRFEGTRKRSWRGPRMGRVPRHQSGDLVAILPPGSDAARLYSLASCSAEKCLEICVARQEGGLCSSFLNGLEPGDAIAAYIEPNQEFKLPRRGKPPVIMIGAGTGIAPFAGMIRNNRRGLPIDLFWGNRHPSSDFFYEDDIATWLEDRRLHNFFAAFSRIDNPSYVQGRLNAQAHHLRDRLHARAVIMVCGSRAMAASVRGEIDQIAAQIGLSVAELKRQGRYLEDIY